MNDKKPGKILTLNFPGFFKSKLRLYDWSAVDVIGIQLVSMLFLFACVFIFYPSSIQDTYYNQNIK